MKPFSIVNIFWFSLILIFPFIGPLYGIALFWFSLTLLALKRFQNKNYDSIKRILFLRLILMLFFVSMLVWVVYNDYQFYPFSSKERTGFTTERLNDFKDNIIYSFLIPSLFILNLTNLIYTSKQKYQYTKILGVIEITVILVFVAMGFVYTFI